MRGRLVRTPYITFFCCVFLFRSTSNSVFVLKLSSDTDDDCDSGLVCYQRTLSEATLVPGCFGTCIQLSHRIILFFLYLHLTEVTILLYRDAYWR
jgi:hypothetical protein